MGRAITAEEFEELYRDTVRDVFAYVRRRAHGDAEDLVAEVYAVGWRRRSDLPAPMLRRAWLFGVARTLLKAEVRLRQREVQLVSDLADRPEPEVKATGDGPAAAAVAAALERLSDADREIIRLVSWEGLTPAELATALGIRPGAARVRLHRARRALSADPLVRALVAQRELATSTDRP